MRRGIRISFAVAAAMCAVVATAGCGSKSAPAAPAVIMARGVAAVEPAADPKPFAAADTEFGLDVLHVWCAQYPGQNLVFSPSTLASALGMAYLGARGSTASAMAGVLHLPADSGTALAAGLQARSGALGKLNGPGVTVAASNQVWADPALTTSPSYLNSVATGYGAGLARAPFSTNPTAAADEINRAISTATRGHITNLVTPDMLSAVGWVLTSALYLNANWANPFEADKTAPGTFTTAGGQSVTASYLNGSGFSYATAGGWTGVSLPYAGGNLTMTALLPPAGSASCALPSQAQLATITVKSGSAGSGTATVSLPKVNLSVSGAQGDMRNVLTELGMGQAFSSSADFTGLSPQAGNLAFVQQAATLAVAEKGTIATAAVAAGVSPADAVVGGTTITFNRPYLMLVTAKATGEPLFLAEVDNPTVG